MKRIIRVLLLEDNPRDAELIQHKLRVNGFAFNIVLADDKDSYEAVLAREPFDLILCDYNLPNYDGMLAIRLARKQQPEVPVIIVSGVLGEEEAIECLKAGATDYVLKQRLQRLVPAVTRALREAEEHRKRLKAEAALRESEQRFRQLAEQSREVFWFYTLNPEQALYISPAVEQVWGLPAERFYLDTHLWPTTIHPDDRNRVARAYKEWSSERSPVYDIEYRIVRPDDSVRWVHDTGTLIRDDGGEIICLSVVAKDITEGRQAQEALQASEQRYRTIFETVSVCIWEEDLVPAKVALDALKAQGVTDLPQFLEQHPEFVRKLAESVQVRDVNQATLALFGARTKEKLLTSRIRVFTNESLSAFCDKLIAIAEEKTYFETEAVNQTLQGERFDLLITMRLPTATEDFSRVLVVGRNITARKRAERALIEEKERAQVTLHSIGDAVITADAAGLVQYLNPVAEMLTGWSMDEARGQPLAHVFYIMDEETREPAPDPVAHCLQKGRIVGLANNTILISRSGWEYAIQDSAAPIRDPEGRLLGAVLVFSDVTETRRLTRAMSYQATHDALTGLINRCEFERRLCRVLETVRTEDTQHAVGYLDLDQFKIINDTWGHAAGDELLRQLSRLLEDQIRKRDTLARLGGDEFGILMEHCTVQQALRVAEVLRKTVENYCFVWEDKCFNIGVSIGLTPLNQASQTVVEVLRAADTACYMAKEQGRNRIYIYQADDIEQARRQGEMQWAVQLPRALEEGRFHLSWQPITSVSQGNEMEHYELLLRLEDETGRLILPGVFLPAAERFNLATPLDRWVISTAFQWLIQHPAQLQQLSFCTINLSGHSLSDQAFLSFVMEQFERVPIPPSKICFEITETVAIANLTHAMRFIKTLKVLGCRFALDDFGSGLSSFGYLKQLPVDFLKIDGMFVKDIVADLTSFAIVKSIHEIGQVMGMQTIAEFVEDECILAKLCEIGVHYAQGYFIGRPQSLKEKVLEK